MTGTTSDKQLSRIVLKGFKSIAKCDLQLYKLNVLIGANGAGKSNFIGFFSMMQQLLDRNLQRILLDMEDRDKQNPYF
jgi:predicted ATPase